MRRDMPIKCKCCGNASGNTSSGPTIVSAALKTWGKSGDPNLLAKALMSTGPGVETRKEALRELDRLAAVLRTRSRVNLLTPEQKARITKVVYVGAAA